MTFKSQWTPSVIKLDTLKRSKRRDHKTPRNEIKYPILDVTLMGHHITVIFSDLIAMSING